MAKIEFPKPLKNLLEDSSLQAPIRAYADRAGEILADNKLPFFPDYTDHGTDHINQVLISEVELVPKEVWAYSTKDSVPRLLSDADAVVIIGATQLHDIAMHLRPHGFLELVSESNRFHPLPWFKDNQEGYAADRPWSDLWLDFQREARRFSDRNLGNIIGLDSVQRGWKFDQLPDDPGQWERNHCLVIGEFIRRHHARLAHEIALYGFPGLEVGSDEGQFPAIGARGNHLQQLADLIGLAARSHGISLRVCQAYLDSSQLYARKPKPMGCAVLYPMALLRVADYLQIDRQRTPAALLKLRNPQSPVSVQEWTKHLAVQYIGPASGPRAKMVTVSPDISQAVYLQLRELLAGLQKEMDHAIAVLDEAYGARTDLGLDHLKLTMRRVYSNLDDPAFRDNLPYVPERTGFASDPNLLTLLVEPLYGKEPSVGVRELMQNAADAVRELHVWCEAHGKKVESLELPKQDSDVQIDFIRRDDETWFLRVTDKGIGMTCETIQNYFLRAGASFRHSADWAKEFLDEHGQPRVLRAGRFGIGIFAVFLLGPKFRLWTRHAGAEKTKGYSVEASASSQLIEIRRADGLPVGTKIEVDISSESAAALELDKERYKDWAGPQGKTDWFCWDWPVLCRCVVRGATPEVLSQKYVVPSPETEVPPPEWSVIHPPGFDAVYWTFADYPTLICNGIKISKPKGYMSDIDWLEATQVTQLKSPNISVVDSVANLPLTTQRYALSDMNLSFIAELSRDVTLSFIAHALVCGPTSRTDAHLVGMDSKPHPLVLYGHGSEDKFRNSLLRWCTTSSAVIPADPWLYSLLQAKACLVFGAVDFDRDYDFERYYDPRGIWTELFTILQAHENRAILSWNTNFLGREANQVVDNLLGKYFPEMVKNGFQILGNHKINFQTLISCHREFEFFDKKKWELGWGDHQEPNWHEITPPNAGRRYFKSQTEIAAKSLPSDRLIETIERYYEQNYIEAIERYYKEWGNRYDEKGKLYNFLFFVEIKTEPGNHEPESLLATIWNECLGPKPIPFDPAARRELIEQGRRHPELKRHIEACEEMKRTGSKWVVGGVRD